MGLTKKVLLERPNQITSCLCAFLAPLRLRGLEQYKKERIDEVNQKNSQHQISKHPGPGIVSFYRHDAAMPSSCFQFRVSKSIRAMMYTTIQTTSKVAKTLARCNM